MHEWFVKPEKFSGEGEKERQEVETWVEDVTAWLDSQFSEFDGDYSEAQWTLVQSLLGGTAKRHMRVAKQTDPSQTWESLKQGLVDFIRGVKSPARCGGRRWTASSTVVTPARTC